MKCNYKAEINFQDKIHSGLRIGSGKEFNGECSCENIRYDTLIFKN